MAIIYKIKNTCTGKCLIGTTKKDLNIAFREWMKNCGRDRYKDTLLAKDALEYGRDKFTIEQLAVCENAGEAYEVADSYIIQFNTLEPYGYNRSFTGIRKRTPDYYGDNDTVRKPVKKKEDSELAEESKEIAKLDFRKKTELLNKYGITGVQRNEVPQILAEPSTIKALRMLADKLERYGSQELYEFVPSELNVETNELKDVLLSLISGNKARISKETFVAIPITQVACTKCGSFRDGELFFFKHPDVNATKDGYIHLCKPCIEEYCKNLYASYDSALYVIMVLCQLTNVIFVQSAANAAKKSWEAKKEKAEDIFKYYMSELKFGWLNRETAPSSMLEFRNSNFQGDILSFAEHHPATPKVLIEELNKKMIEQRTIKETEEQDTLEAKWGKGFDPQEYRQLEQEYKKLEKFLTKKTDLHIEALKKYIIYSLKEKNALAKGDLKDVKEWSGLADKAADNAQLKIKQLSDNFSTEIDGFAKLVEAVEEYNSVIPILPKVRKMPYDDIDFIIWENVNYVRRLEGKPETTYEEVYSFIDTELTRKLVDKGFTPEQIQKEKEKRNAVFRDLSENYTEPLWMVPEDEDDEDEEVEGGDGNG